MVDPKAGQLIFNSVEKNDQSLYSCRAINDVGVDEQNINLEVLSKYEFVFMLFLCLFPSNL